MYAKIGVRALHFFGQYYKPTSHCLLPKALSKYANFLTRAIEIFTVSSSTDFIVIDRSTGLGLNLCLVADASDHAGHGRARINFVLSKKSFYTFAHKKSCSAHSPIPAVPDNIQEFSLSFISGILIINGFLEDDLSASGQELESASSV